MKRANGQIAAPEKAANTFSFEEMMERLGQIVKALEQGDLPLEDSIDLFEEGMRLTKAGTAKLDDAERKVDLLLRDEGQEKRVPFDLDGVEKAEA
jgi:exodeoxyribonuclease VII small subunit